jgi:nucleoside-diphosphate-sugar epimerase
MELIGESWELLRASDLEKEFGYRPSTTLEEGLKAFAAWYKSAKS